MAHPPLVKNRLAVAGRAQRQKGNVILEFAIVAMAAIPMIFGMIALGLTLGRGIQATQVVRDVGNMYSRSVDLTSAGTLNIVTKLAQDFNLHPTTGSAVLMLSKITRVSQLDCTAASVATCVNDGQPVVTQRLVIGNASLRASNFATPPAGTVNATTGNIQPADYLQNPLLVAAGFATLLPQNPGDTAWVVEGFFQQPDLNFLLPAMGHSTEGTYIHAIF